MRDNVRALIFGLMVAAGAPVSVMGQAAIGLQKPEGYQRVESYNPTSRAARIGGRDVTLSYGAAASLQDQLQRQGVQPGTPFNVEIEKESDPVLKGDPPIVEKLHLDPGV
jgi:hypothetical protein